MCIYRYENTFQSEELENDSVSVSEQQPAAKVAKVSEKPELEEINFIEESFSLELAVCLFRIFYESNICLIDFFCSCFFERMTKLPILSSEFCSMFKCFSSSVWLTSEYERSQKV